MIRPIFEVWPRLRERAPFAELGVFPTPLVPLDEVAAAAGAGAGVLWEKRDDLTSPSYGGNKVRTIEVLFGHALSRGCSRVYATGAYGSNHAAAATLHAPRVALEPGIILYPQPHSRAALENLEVVLSRRPAVCDLPHWSALPYGMLRTAVGCRREGVRAFIMEPGGAIPLGALGYVSAGFELAIQVSAGVMPAPETVMVAIGSNCTSAGLLLGFHLARRLGLGLERLPRLVSVRVTPWPVTSRWRVLRLASQTSALLAALVGDASLEMRPAELGATFRLDGDYIGPGYGYATDAGREAMRIWAAHAGHALETTYSGKAAAAVLDALPRARGPVVYWSTKSSAPLPEVDPAALSWAPARMRRWMDDARRLETA